MKTFLQILLKYIKQYRLVAACLVMFCGIFAGIFSLYHLDIEAVIYASVLCFLSGIVVLAINFIGYYKKHCELIQLRANINLLNECMPKASNLIEEDFLNMIEDLQKMCQENISLRNIERKDSIDYYTTWVHQIKAPIAVIRLILQGNDTEENKELLSELFRIEQYVEMVLCYFRLDSSSSDFVIQEYNIDGIIKRAIRKFAPQFIRKKIRLNYEKTDVLVLTDEKWLLFIVEQLLTNAIKYTKSGSITIDIDEKKVLRITDTGIGIAKEDLPRIFEKGFTGYNGRRNNKSTGLGLYLCKKAANKLSHEVGVTSQVGDDNGGNHGTTFTIDLLSKKLQVE